MSSTPQASEDNDTIVNYMKKEISDLRDKLKNDDSSCK